MSFAQDAETPYVRLFSAITGAVFVTPAGGEPRPGEETDFRQA
jgi:hypothetical protein